MTGYYGKYKRRSMQDAGVTSKSWDSWDPKIEPDWTVIKGFYWKMGDSIWHPKGAVGQALVKKLKRRIESQMRWVFSRRELVQSMIRTRDIEGSLERAFREAGKESLLYGTVRRTKERINRMRTV